MLSSIQDSPLAPIINPRSIAFFGASNRFTSMGTNQLSSLQELGFNGTIYPVHPREKEVLGVKAYARVSELPEVPDVAVIVLPTDVVPQVLEDCGRKGIRRAIIVSGGFKEVGGQGIDLERAVIEVADRYDIRFLGPNCLGVTPPHHNYNVTFLPFEGKPGFIGMASQSGSFVTQMFGYLSDFGLGFSSAISVGNEANLDIVDCMQYLAACPHTKVIALYVETIRRGRAFLEIARRIAPHKPIVALYVGGSEAGRRASFSHTGALSGPDQLYDGVFRQAGVIRAHSITELFDFCCVLALSHEAKGKRVAVQTHSGGPGVATADACQRFGLQLPGFSAETLDKLKPLAPHTASLSNPVDLTFTKNPLDYFDKIPDVLLSDSHTDSVLIYFLTPLHAAQGG
jgi:acyl-CoA synthetase (NDP forming)